MVGVLLLVVNLDDFFMGYGLGEFEDVLSIYF